MTRPRARSPQNAIDVILKFSRRSHWDFHGQAAVKALKTAARPRGRAGKKNVRALPSPCRYRSSVFIVFISLWYLNVIQFVCSCSISCVFEKYFLFQNVVSFPFCVFLFLFSPFSRRSIDGNDTKWQIMLF